MVWTMCCLATGRTRRLMNPLPATSARSSHSDGGSAATSSRASSRGLRLRERASCMAAGQEKSPCCTCWGRSREISEPGCCGATLASARVSNSVRWDLTSADIEGPYYTRALIIAGRAKVEYRASTFRYGVRTWAKAINARSAARSSRDRTARPDHASRKDRRRNPPDFRGRSKLYRIHVQMPAHSVRRHAVEGIAPFREERLQARPGARLHEHLRALHARESRERHRHRIEHGDRGAPARRLVDGRSEEALRAKLIGAFRAQCSFENEWRKPRLPAFRQH